MKKIDRDYFFFLNGALIGIGGGFVGSLFASIFWEFISLQFKNNTSFYIICSILYGILFFFILFYLNKKIKKLKNEK